MKESFWIFSSFLYVNAMLVEELVFSHFQVDVCATTS